MATVLGNSIFGLVSGRVGNFVYSIKNGKQYVQAIPEHTSKPKTQGQLEQTAKFKTIINFLKPLTPFLRVGFYKKKSILSPSNAAMSYNYKNALAGSYPDYYIDYSKVLVSQGPLPGALNPEVRLTPEGEIEFTWENNSIANEAMSDDKVLLVAYNSDKQEVVSIMGGNLRSDGSQVVTLPSTFAGDEVQCHIAFQNTHKLIVSDSEYIGKILITVKNE